ncbi:hypothetical protein [Neisseria sp.]|uniref:hypothetical protein n=1 Tax=Neisseria sp. TaxID=192066 RepID=UPI0026DC9546|nr:hypothetical protein [Neisseria sp.]MDO4226595.1 hypothetical protein [Neisseria sp.]
MDDVSAAQVMAALLESAKVCLPFNLLFTAYGLWQMSGITAALNLLLVLWIVYLHVRIAFDRRIFQAFFSGSLNTTGFDAALADTGLRKQDTHRSMPSRCRGAVKLWKLLLAATAVQGVEIVVYAELG